MRLNLLGYGERQVDKVRLLLTIVTIIIIAIPIVGIVIAYRNNPQELFIPPELDELATTLFSGNGSASQGWPTPAIVGPIEYDPTTRSATFTFEYTNSFPVGVTLNSLTAAVNCATHGTFLGTASLRDPIWIGAGETKKLTVVAVWTDAALAHFQNQHQGEDMIAVDLTNIAVNAGGLIITSNQPIRINDVPIA